MDFSTVKAFVFDMDGLLLDTERLCLNSFMKACLRYGIDERVSRPLFINVIGNNAVTSNAYFTREFAALGVSFDELKHEWDEDYHGIITNQPIPLMPGVEALLECLHENNQPMGVATSTRREMAIHKLQSVGVYDYFQFVVGGDEVANGKPNPEIYLKAVGIHGERPEDCLAFEDSTNGVLSAIGAGMHVVQVPNLVPVTDELRAHGHHIVSSLSDVVPHFSVSNTLS